MRHAALHTRLAVVAAAFVASAAATACGEAAQGPAFERSAPLALSVEWPAGTTANAVFGADIDSVSVVVARRNESTAAEAVFPFPAGREGLAITLDVPLEQKTETLSVYVDLRAGQSTRFYSNAQVVLRVGTIPAIPSLPLTYVGPGFDAVFLTISPRTGFVVPGGTLQFSASAQNGQQAIVAPPIGWSVSDTRLATISASGLLTARSGTGTVRVRAVTPNGVADSLNVLISAQLP